MWHLELPEMKAEVILVALLRLPRKQPQEVNIWDWTCDLEVLLQTPKPRKCQKDTTQVTLVDVSDIFYFFLLGGGEGESEEPGMGGGVGFLLEIPRERGGGLPGEGPKGREGVCGGLGGIGGLNIFFRAETPTK